MKTKNHKHISIHQRIERLLRHRIMLAGVLTFMFFGVLSLDGRTRGFVQQAYVQGWNWFGTFLHHEHPMHGHLSIAIARHPTISGPGPL